MLHRLLLASLLVSGCASAPTPGDEEGSTESSIIGGIDDPSDRAVVDIAFGADASSLSGRCTGTLIAPRLVVTAGHCVVSHDPSDPSPKVWGVLFGADENAAGAMFSPVVRGVAHPRWAAGDEAGSDVSVLVLAEPAPVAPVRINRRALPDSFAGSHVRAVGYGSNDGTTNTTGKRAAVIATVNQVATHELSIGKAGQTTCHGDSGGPVFGHVRGRTVLLGVTSRGDRADCAGISISTRVDSVLDFLDPLLQNPDAE